MCENDKVIMNDDIDGNTNVETTAAELYIPIRDPNLAKTILIPPTFKHIVKLDHQVRLDGVQVRYLGSQVHQCCCCHHGPQERQLPPFRTRRSQLE